VPNYLVLISEYFKCVLGTSRISGGVRSVPGVLEVFWNWSIVQREGSIEASRKLDRWSDKGVSGSPGQGVCGGSARVK